MNFRKITKDDAENLKEGDVVFIYPSNRGISDSFDETDIDNISPTIVHSISFGNIELSFAFPKEGFDLALYKVKIGTLHKKLNQLYEQGRYWIQEK